MRDDYKMSGPLMKVEIEVEAGIAEKLIAMEKFSKFTRSELANVALKRFISHHKDWLPPEENKGKK